jgi:hypothetical protein
LSLLEVALARQMGEQMVLLQGKIADGLEAIQERVKFDTDTGSIVKD